MTISREQFGIRGFAGFESTLFRTFLKIPLTGQNLEGRIFCTRLLAFLACPTLSDLSMLHQGGT
jgi:hypothetical protein